MGWIKRTLCALLALGLLGSMAACKPLTQEEAEAKENFKETAVQYYEEKYGEKPVIESYGYHTDIGLFATRTEDLVAKCQDGTVIFYDTSKELIVDNRQSDEISNALEPVFLDQVEAIAGRMEDAEAIVAEADFSAWAWDYEGSFYHTYFDGDVEEFIRQENIQLQAEIYLICDREDSWEKAAGEFEELLRSDYRDWNDVDLTVLSRDCYDKYQAGIYRYPGVDMLECYAVYDMERGGIDRYIQNYIKVTDGVYVTSNEANFVLEEGDVTLVESEWTQEDLNRIIYGEYASLPEQAEENKKGYSVPDKEHEDYFVISADTPIWHVRLSDRVKELYPEELTVYLRFVPEELGLSGDKRFFYYPAGDKVYLNCFDIHTSLADADFANLNEEDYYFAGSQERQID